MPCDIDSMVEPFESAKEVDVEEKVEEPASVVRSVVGELSADGNGFSSLVCSCELPSFQQRPESQRSSLRRNCIRDEAAVSAADLPSHAATRTLLLSLHPSPKGI